MDNLIYNYKIELKRVLSKTSQISETTQGGNASLKFVILHCEEEGKLGDRNESSFRKLIKSHELGVTQLFKDKSNEMIRSWK